MRKIDNCGRPSSGRRKPAIPHASGLAAFRNGPGNAVKGLYLHGVPVGPIVTTVILSLTLVTGCTGTSPVQPEAEMVTVTATATVTVSPDPQPSSSFDPEGRRRDAQHIVDLTCKVQTAYLAFDQVASDLPANPQNFREAKSLAADVAFAIEGLSALSIMGPAEGWTDPWLALRALQFSEAVDGSRAYFESAAKAKSVDDLISLFFGVLDNPINPAAAGDLPGWLPPEQADQFSRCAAVS